MAAPARPDVGTTETALSILTENQCDDRQTFVGYVTAHWSWLSRQ